MNCPICLKSFLPSVPFQKYCSTACCVKANNNDLQPPRDEFIFRCAHCGKLVVTEPFKDYRYKYCSKRCHDRAHEQRKDKRKRVGNNGLSGGMSLGSLIKRERRCLD